MIQYMQPSALRIARASGLVLVLMSAGAVSAAPRTDDARAKRFFKQGKAAFELGKFDAALEAYEKAYELTPLPGFLFNIGQCHRNLGHHENAIFSFRLYLQKDPEAKNRLAVEDLIQKLEAKQANILAERQRKKREEQQAAARRERAAERQRQINERLARQLLLPADRAAPPREVKPASSPLYKRWWFWTGISALLLGGAAVGTYFALRPREVEPPPSGFPVVLDFSRLP